MYVHILIIASTTEGQEMSWFKNVSLPIYLWFLESIWSTLLIKTGCSVFSDIHMTNDKNYHFNAQTTWGHQIWTIDTSRVVDQLETYSVATDRVIPPVSLPLRKGYGYQMYTPGLVRNVIDNLRQNISISKIKLFSFFNTVLLHPKWDSVRSIMCHHCACIWIFLLKYFCKSLIL